MKTFKHYVAEVQQPLSQGEQNFKSIHTIDHKTLVPGVTDQDFVFNGSSQKKDPKSASYEDDQSEKAYDKTLKVKEDLNIDEARRGRPSKNASGDEEGGREHIVVQLRKVVNLRGAKPVEFNDNSKKDISIDHAKKALEMHSNMKPIEKGEFESRLAKSHDSFHSAIKGEPAEKAKPKITLGSMRKESMDDPYTVSTGRGAMTTYIKVGADGRPKLVKKQAARKEIKVESMDPVGKEDQDVDNNGKVDKSDQYLMKRRTAIKKAIKEALIGNQHRIDANKNNKIDAHDFKLLKKKKKVAEEASKENMQQDSIDKIEKDPLASKIKIKLPATQGNKSIGGEEQTHTGKYSVAEQEVLNTLYNSLSEENQSKFEQMLETDQGVEQLIDFAKQQGF